MDILKFHRFGLLINLFFKYPLREKLHAAGRQRFRRAWNVENPWILRLGTTRSTDCLAGAQTVVGEPPRGPRNLPRGWPKNFFNGSSVGLLLSSSIVTLLSLKCLLMLL